MMRPVIFLLILFVSTFISCKNEPEAAIKAVPVAGSDTIFYNPPGKEGAVEYTVTGGTVFWAGKKPFGDSHEGTLQIASGKLLVNQGILVGGDVEIDMHSLTVTSIKDSGEKRDLESHLKDTDFFEARKFPVATFSFNQVLPSNTKDFNQAILGELTIKGKTNTVNVPVQLDISDNTLEARSPSFSINRTRWGINFRSSLSDTVKDKLIDDSILLSIRLSARRNEKG